MKVVLFCGGYGMRMRGGSADELPKPMQLVGPHPLLLHVMNYYAGFGYTQFVLCLGYGARQIEDYFAAAQPPRCWDIAFVDTGLDTGIGDRLRAVRDRLGEDEIFLANYADVLSDVDLDDLIARFADQPQMVASLLAVPPQSSFHVLDLADASASETGARPVRGLRPVSGLPIWENGGYLILRREIFDWLPPGADLVGDACARLAEAGRLLAQPHRGFWKPADTFKERAELDAMWQRGQRPWVIGGES